MTRATIRWIAAGLLAAFCAAGAAAAAEPPFQQLSLVLHAHSTMSTGDLPLDQLVQQAQSIGLDGLVLTENYELGVEYGLWPLNGLLRYRVGLPSITEQGLADYLKTVQEVRQRHPGMVIIPGLEVTPHYHWSGSLWGNNLRLNNTQKNLLIIGVDADASKIGNALSERRPAVPWTARLVDGWPLLLLAAGVWLWRYERVTQAKTKLYKMSQRHTYRKSAAALMIIGGLFLSNHLMLAFAPFDAYRADPHERAAQALIDRAQAAGAATIWSLPEASDFHEYDIRRIAEELAQRGGAAGLLSGPLSRLPWTITVKTDPYLGALAETIDYTGFGAVYQDNVRAVEPGGEWDELLLDYVNGHRPAPVWGVGELAYHQAGLGNKRLSDVQTVVLVRERSTDAALAAIKRGAFYARQRLPGWGYRLDDWSIRVGAQHAAPLQTTEGGVQRVRPAIAGETLVAPPASPITITVAVSTTDRRAEKVTVRVIRSGRLWQEFAGTTPFSRQLSDRAERAYYRVEVGKGDQHLLGNPIFTAVSEN